MGVVAVDVSTRYEIFLIELSFYLTFYRKQWTGECQNAIYCRVILLSSVSVLQVIFPRATASIIRALASILVSTQVNSSTSTPILHQFIVIPMWSHTAISMYSFSSFIPHQPLASLYRLQFFQQHPRMADSS